MDTRIGTALSYILSEVLRDYPKNSIAKSIGCSPATMTRYLKGTRVFSIDHLEKLSLFLGKKAYHYFEELFNDIWKFTVKEKISKVKELLEKSIEYNQIDLIHKIVDDYLLEKGGYLVELYNVGETLFAKNKYKEAQLFYDIVIENHTDRTDPILAMSYYKKFLIVRNDGLDIALEASLTLSEHIKNIEVPTMFEAYIKIFNVFYVLEKWDNLLKCSQKVADSIECSEKIDVSLYVGCLVYIAIACRHKGDYQKAREIINQYENFGGKYSIWAGANRLVVDIEAGEKQKVRELEAYVTKHREEAPKHLEYILHEYVATRNYSEMDRIFKKFNDCFLLLESLSDPINQKRLSKLYYYQACYFMGINEVEKSFICITKAINIAQNIKISNQLTIYTRFLINYIHRVNAPTKNKLVNQI
ncbi:helix-turn-helix transcriptional regulator [Brevibacillus laterosporus]|uniref:helix-turn-helix domain-containing protein n=1 Tax=Brevibacillus laterosporus TaxID=1465 RepID=UPI003D1ED4D9